MTEIPQAVVDVLGSDQRVKQEMAEYNRAQEMEAAVLDDDAFDAFVKNHLHFCTNDRAAVTKRKTYEGSSYADDHHAHLFRRNKYMNTSLFKHPNAPMVMRGSFGARTKEFSFMSKSEYIIEVIERYFRIHKITTADTRWLNDKVNDLMNRRTFFKFNSGHYRTTDAVRSHFLQSRLARRFRCAIFYINGRQFFADPNSPECTVLKRGVRLAEKLETIEAQLEYIATKEDEDD